MKQYIALTGKMVFTTALHIGSGKPGETTDAPLRRNAEGNIVLPGTAIAGALRATATRLAPRIKFQNAKKDICLALEENGKEDETCHCQVCHLFGDLNPGVNEDGITDKAKLTHASRLWIYDATLSAEQAGALVRDGVGIDRQSGASASAGAAKFDLEVLPAGTSFELRLELQDSSDEDKWLLAATLAEWQAERGRLGGRTARGLGAFKLDELKCTEIDLAKDILIFLRSEKPWQVGKPNDEWMKDNLGAAIKLVQPVPASSDNVKAAIAQSWVTVTFDLQFQGPFLIHDATLAGLIGYAHAPLLQQLPPAKRDANWQAQPVLSGAGLRGVLRSHAERIARTLATHQAWGKDNQEKYFLDHCPACNPLQSKEKEPLANCDKLLAKHPVTEKIVLSSHQSAEKEHLCLACWLFGSTRRGSRLAIQDASMMPGDPTKRLYKPQDFLAIDRFTGGGLEGAKFDALGLYAPRFHVCMHLENPADWELGWLTLVLRDLRDELVTFGFGAAKGYGMANAENFEVKFGFISSEDIPLTQQELETAEALQARQKAFAQLASQTEESLYQIVKFFKVDYATHKNILQAWVTKLNGVVKNFDRAQMALPAPVSDTYFNGELPRLYPLDQLGTPAEAT